MVKDNSPAQTPEVDLTSYALDQQVLNLIPATLAEKYHVIPIFKVGESLTLAMANPKDIMALDAVRRHTNLDLEVVKSSLESINEAISEYYGIAAIIEEVLKEYHQPHEEKKLKTSIMPAEAPIVKLVNAVLFQAVSERASDIHVEPEATKIRIRYRVDGTLHEEAELPSFMLSPLVSRIKVLSSMDIAESRLPQDGRFEMDLEGKKVDFRVSTFPTAYGEKTVLRILDKSMMHYSLEKVGLNPQNVEIIKKLIRKPHGIFLVTGPTGSGKTTTLYGALSEMNSEELNIVTVEDPIEYELPGITQSQVNTKAGLTFASALRSILRQDPDVIFVGEIRDLETANIAIRSALTGHLVFSTLHTNDSASAITRLIDMGVEPFLLASTIEGILAQRLVRKIDPKCVAEAPVPDNFKSILPGVTSLKYGKGCKACKGTGFKGRTGVFEFLLVDDKIKKMIAEKVASDEIKKYAVSKGMKTLYDDGIEKVKAGETTIEEVLRVTELEQI